MNIKKIYLLIVTSLLLINFISCLSVDYKGKTFPATDKALIFNKKEEIDKKYSVMGKAHISAPRKYTVGELKKALLEKAEKVGADAVLITKYKIVRTNLVREDQINNTGPNSGGWTPDDNTADGWGHVETEFNEGRVNQSEQPSFKIVMYADFLKFDK